MVHTTTTAAADTKRHESRFFSLVTAQQTVSNTDDQVAWMQSCTNHVYTSGACAMCHVVRRDSSAIKFDRVEIAFTLVLFRWLKPLTDEGGRQQEYPEKTPDHEIQKMPHNKVQNSSPNRDWN